MPTSTALWKLRDNSSFGFYYHDFQIDGIRATLVVPDGFAPDANHNPDHHYIGTLYAPQFGTRVHKQKLSAETLEKLQDAAFDLLRGAAADMLKGITTLVYMAEHVKALALAKAIWESR